MIALAEEHEHGGSFWSDYISVQFDPAHLLAELGFTLVFEALTAFLIVWLWRKVLKPRLSRQIHAQIDAEHGYTHTPKHTPEAVSGRLRAVEGDSDFKPPVVERREPEPHWDDYPTSYPPPRR